MESSREPKPSATPQKPVNQLVREVASSLRGIIDGELNLARAELRHAAEESRTRSARAAAFTAVAAIGVLPLLASAVLTLGAVLEGNYALSAFLIGAALVAVGGILAWLNARHLHGNELSMPRTRKSLMEEGRFFEQETSHLAEHALRSVNDAIRRESRKRRPAS